MLRPMRPLVIRTTTRRRSASLDRRPARTACAPPRRPRRTSPAGGKERLAGFARRRCRQQARLILCAGRTAATLRRKATKDLVRERAPPAAVRVTTRKPRRHRRHADEGTYGPRTTIRHVRCSLPGKLCIWSGSRSHERSCRRSNATLDREPPRSATLCCRCACSGSEARATETRSYGHAKRPVPHAISGQRACVDGFGGTRNHRRTPGKAGRAEMRCRARAGARCPPGIRGRPKGCDHQL